MSLLIGAGGARAVWFSGSSRRPLRLLLAVVGIASGVALSFAVAAQNASLTHGAADVYRQLAGNSTLELVALGPRGMPLSTADRIRALPGVRAAAPITEEIVTVRHGSRSVDVRLFGLDDHAGSLGGALAGNIPRIKPGGTIGLYLPASLARNLRVGTEDEVRVYSRIGLTPTYVAQVLPSRKLGRLSDTGIALAPLSLAELLTGGGDSVQRILVVAKGHQTGLPSALRHVGGRGTMVWSTAAEIRAVEQASGLNRESSSLFAALSLVVGGLLAYGAMVLIMAERRHEVATLRMLGAGLGALLQAVLLDALLMGLAGTALGLVVGRLAVGWLLPHDNSFLSSAFLLSNRIVVPLGVIGAGFAGGVVTVLVAVMLPARALARVAPAEALTARADVSVIGLKMSGAVLVGLVVVLAGAGVLTTLQGQGDLGVPLWIFAGLAAVPLVVGWVSSAVHRLLPSPGAAARVGIAEIAASPGRAVAATAVVMLAVSGLLAVGGSASNLQDSTARLSAASYPPKDLFVTSALRGEVFFTQPIAASTAGRLKGLPFVSRIVPWRSAFLDWQQRRVLMFAFTEGRSGVRAGEFIEGNPLRAADALTNTPAAVAVSQDLANAHGLHVGSRFRLSTPSGPQLVRVVATITNYGWTPGAVAIEPASFTSWWGRDYVTAYQLSLSPKTSTRAAIQRIGTALQGTGLSLLTSSQMRARVSAAARAQLADLRRIGELIAIAGGFAVAAVTLAGVLARARRMSALRTIGMSRRHVIAALGCEAGWMIAIGALLGALVGIIGHALAIEYLASKFAMTIHFKPYPYELLVVAGMSAAIALAATLVATRAVFRLPLAESLRDV